MNKKFIALMTLGIAYADDIYTSQYHPNGVGAPLYEINTLNALKKSWEESSVQTNESEKIAGYSASEVWRLAITADLAYKVKKEQAYDPALFNFVEMYKLTDNSMLGDNSGFISVRENGDVVLSFAGTTSMKNVLTDAWANWAFDRENGGCYHNGILVAFRSLETQIMRTLNTIAANNNLSLKDLVAKTEITGHSLGGGMALVAADILRRQGLEAKGVVTFAAPRVMDVVTATTYDKEMRDKSLVVKQFLDPVPVISPFFLGPKQVGEQLLLPFHLPTWHHSLGGYIAALEAFERHGNVIDVKQFTFGGLRNPTTQWYFERDATKNQTAPGIVKTAISLGMRATHRIALDTVEEASIMANTVATNAPRLAGAALLKTISYSAYAAWSSAEYLNDTYFTDKSDKIASAEQKIKTTVADALKGAQKVLTPVVKTAARIASSAASWVWSKVVERTADFVNDVNDLLN
jgi:hypothetical protein